MRDRLKKRADTESVEPLEMLIPTTTLRRLYQLARTLGTFSQQDTCADDTLQALFAIYDLQKAMLRTRTRELHRSLLHHLLRAPAGVSVEDDPLVSRLWQEMREDAPSAAEQEDEDPEVQERLAQDERQEPLDPKEVAEAERYDQTLTMLLDLCEQHPTLVRLYVHERMAALLTPLATQLGTKAPLETLQALKSAYHTNQERLQMLEEAYRTYQSSIQTLQTLLSSFPTREERPHLLEETHVPAPASLGQPPGEQGTAPTRQRVRDDHRSKADSPKTPRAHAAEQRTSKRPPLIASPNNDGTYVLSSPTLGSIGVQPDSQEWFRWLASLSSFRFIGPSGRLSACRGYDHGPTRTWSAYRTSQGKLYKRYLGATDQLTIAHLDHMAAHLQSCIDAAGAEGETPRPEP